MIIGVGMLTQIFTPTSLSHSEDDDDDEDEYPCDTDRLYYTRVHPEWKVGRQDWKVVQKGFAARVFGIHHVSLHCGNHL